MSVNPSYIPSSLRNLEPVAGNITGFRFVCRLENPFNTLLYSIHEMSVIVDGLKILTPQIRMTFNGSTMAATELPHTTWVGLRGDPIEIEADLSGGLKNGPHDVRLEALFGGGFSCGMETTPEVLCEITGANA